MNYDASSEELLVELAQIKKSASVLARALKAAMKREGWEPGATEGQVREDVICFFEELKHCLVDDEDYDDYDDEYADEYYDEDC